MKSLQLSKPYLLVMVGIPGSGKTAFASQFAAMFNTSLVDYVQLLYITQGNITVTYHIIHYLLEQLMKTEQTIVLDGPGDRASDRRELINMARRHGYTPLFIWVQTEPITAEHRAVRSKSATMSKADFDARVAEFEYLTNVEPVLVISGKHTFATQARMVLRKLTSERTAGTQIQIQPSPSQAPVQPQPRPRPLPPPPRGRFIR